jgi:hypothetical protein
VSFWWAIVMPGGALGMSDDGTGQPRPTRQATGQQPARLDADGPGSPCRVVSPGLSALPAHDRRMPDYQLPNLKVGTAPWQQITP